MNDLNTETLGLLALVRGHGAYSHLHQPIHQPFFHNTGKRTGMGQPVTAQFVIKVGMRVDM